MVNKNEPKSYVIDTCVLINDDESLFKWEENVLILPSIVWEELNNLKDTSQNGYIPRKILRLLTELSTVRPLREGVYLRELPSTSNFYEKCKDLDTKIIISYEIENEEIDKSFKMKKYDYNIISCAKNNNSILVTMDIGLLGIARDFVKAEEHSAEKIQTKEIYTGYRFATVNSSFFEEFGKNKKIEDSFGLHPNEFIIFEEETNSKWTLVGIKKWGIIKLVNFDEELQLGKMKTKPINLEQKMLLYLLQDPEILCVSVTGISGRGKSLVCTDFAFAEVMKRNYNQFLYTKSVIPVDEKESMGFYKGTLDEKLKPHLQPLFSCIEYLYRDQIYGKENKEEKNNDKNNGFKKEDKIRMTAETKFEDLRGDGILDVFPLAEIRGMNIFKKIVMLDEAQNTKKHMIKTLVTRLTDESKLIVTGDVEQIDDPKLNVYNNGLSHLIEQGKDEQFIAHITLNIDKKDSKRGKLATFGSMKL